MPTEAFNLYPLDHPHLARTLKGKLLKRRAELSGEIVYGTVSDWADYKQRIGVIKGLDEAVELCEQTEKEER